ncbi:hypothetical protein GCM10027592_00940 [Spirosoma flavus]
MLLSFTALDEKAQWREFACDMIGLDDVFDFLSVIAAEGHIIVQASIHEDGIRTELPGEAFDGKSVTIPIRQLEKQWKKALKNPLGSPDNSDQFRQEIMRQRIAIYTSQIVWLKSSINRFQEMQQRTDAFIFSPDRKDKLVGHYERTIANYRYLLEKALTDRYAVQAKLKQLVV